MGILQKRAGHLMDHNVDVAGRDINIVTAD
jgi:hypothetical protein